VLDETLLKIHKLMIQQLRADMEVSLPSMSEVADVFSNMELEG